MNWKKITQLVIVLSIGLLFLYDYLALSAEGFDATISNQLYTMSQKVPIVAFGLGILMGHLFWPIYMKCPKCNYNGNYENYGEGKK